MTLTAETSVRCALALMVLTAACAPRDSASLRRFPLTGAVVSHDPAAGRVVVAHDEIPGLMPAMSMPFEVSGAAARLREGDRISAVLVVTSSRSWLEDVRITEASRVAAAGVPEAGGAAPGVVLPAFPLVDQNGRALTLGMFAGRVLVLTFVYTRCPLPDFCPLMVKHLERVRHRANKEGIGSRLAVVGVTLDPRFDSPAVLRAYGEVVLKGANRFDQWTLATGTPAQVADVARFFGVAYRGENDLVTHTLSTTVIAHDGRIMRTFTANSWRPDELFDVVRQGAARAAVR